MVDLYAEEQVLRAEGFELLAGVDEVGRGCLAGPVFAAAVILPQDLKIPQLNDSKKLSPQLREKISAIILQQALAYKIERVSVEEIDRINILQASLKAMQLAIAGLLIFPKLLLIDGNQQVEVSIPQKTVIQGDGRCASIAAASVIAKVARDRYMAEQEKIFPQFSFSQHKGYGTAQHLEELKKHGPTPLHRRSFAPVRDL
jgi:ribonuclease HII